MDDDEILSRIRTMVDEEHALRRSGEMVDDSRKVRALRLRGRGAYVQQGRHAGHDLG